MKSESRVLFTAMLLLVAAVIVGIIVAAQQASRNLHVAQHQGNFDVVLGELDRSQAIIKNLPGGVTRVDAKTGVVLDVNVGALEIFGTRGLEVGRTMFDAIADESYRNRHINEIFGENWEEVWDRRKHQGALTVEDCRVKVSGNGYRIATMRIVAVETNGRKEYDVFIDPRTSTVPLNPKVTEIDK